MVLISTVQACTVSFRQYLFFGGFVQMKCEKAKLLQIQFKFSPKMMHFSEYDSNHMLHEQKSAFFSFAVSVGWGGRVEAFCVFKNTTKNIHYPKLKKLFWKKNTKRWSGRFSKRSSCQGMSPPPCEDRKIPLRLSGWHAGPQLHTLENAPQNGGQLFQKGGVSSSIFFSFRQHIFQFPVAFFYLDFCNVCLVMCALDLEHFPLITSWSTYSP